MFAKSKRFLFLSGLLCAGSLFARAEQVVSISTRLLEFGACLAAPFFIWFDFFNNYPTLFLILSLSCVIGIESYTIHCLLKRPCSFVVPRMICINIINMVAQCGLLYGLFILFDYVWVLLFKAKYFFETFQEFKMIQEPWIVKYHPFLNQKYLILFACIGLLLTIIIFSVRVFVVYNMFSWFDPSIEKPRLKRAVFYANLASYLFLYFMPIVLLLCF